MKHLILILITLAFAPLASAQGAYQIRPGDTLDISVLEDPNLNRSVLVRPDGGISMPIAGNIQAAGNSITAVERAITERLASGFSVTPTVSVALTGVGQPVATGRSSTFRVYFVGEVGTQGELRVRRGTSVLQAIAQAGGLTQFAAEKRIQIRRTVNGQESIYLFDYNAVQRGVGIKNNLPLRAGDIIVVPERRLFE